MIKTVYMCDACGNDLGEKKNISVNFSNFSGIYAKPKHPDNQRWNCVQSLQGRFMHFCSAKCIGAFFVALMKRDEKKK